MRGMEDIPESASCLAEKADSGISFWCTRWKGRTPVQLLSRLKFAKNVCHVKGQVAADKGQPDPIMRRVSRH